MDDYYLSSYLQNKHYIQKEEEVAYADAESFLAQCTLLDLEGTWLGDNVLGMITPVLFQFLGTTTNKVQARSVANAASDRLRWLSAYMIDEAVLRYPKNTPYLYDVDVSTIHDSYQINLSEELEQWYEERRQKITWMQKRLLHKYESRTSSTS